MPTPIFTFGHAGRTATTQRLKFTDMSDAALTVWKMWFEDHYEQDYSDPRERSYFRINKANCHAETIWRYSGIPF